MKERATGVKSIQERVSFKRIKKYIIYKEEKTAEVFIYLFMYL